MKSFINIFWVAGVHSLLSGVFTDAFPVWSEPVLTALGLNMRKESVVREDLVIPDPSGRGRRNCAAELWECSQTATCVTSGSLDRETGRATMKISLQQQASSDLITGSHSAHGVQKSTVERCSKFKTTTEALVLHSGLRFYPSRSMH